ncbi:MAG: hypothetical protein K8M05_39535, partial [Deltaproteobacteria bacterium]|nr:hypothetical protein [Kofleriaceae bacterium]
MLQLIRHELDGGDEKLAELVYKVASGRVGDSGKRLAEEIKRVEKERAKAEKEQDKKGKGKGKGEGKAETNGANGHFDPTRDPSVAPALAEHTGLLRLLGYLARPSSQSLLVKESNEERPRPVRFAAIAALRRIVAASEAKGTEAAIEALIEYADGDDLGIAQAAIDTLRGARIPEKLAKPFAALARSKNPSAQKLAMERLPAGGGAGAVKA